VVEAKAGLSGEADAMVTGQAALALCVATADCLPIVVAGARSVAAIHAGWRGLTRAVIEQALKSLGERPDQLTAWIGPAIGACCYEVGLEVADLVAASSTDEVIVAGDSGRPHLDLQRAARWQLERRGVEQVLAVARCTKCELELLSSYRREGRRAGRNWTFAWRRGQTTG
jgi:YfiH family protein